MIVWECLVPLAVVGPDGNGARRAPWQENERTGEPICAL